MSFVLLPYDLQQLQQQHKVTELTKYKEKKLKIFQDNNTMNILF